MIIFNNTDHPLAVFVGDFSVVIEAGRYYEDPLIEGEYAFRAYKLRSGGQTRKLRGKMDEDWGIMGYRFCPCLGLSGTLVAERDAKLHIDEQYRRLSGWSRDKRELEFLHCTVENGELKHPENYFTSSYWRQRELVYNYLLLGFLIPFNLLMLSIPQYDIAAFALKFLFQGLFLFLDWECIRAIRILRAYPIRQEKDVIAQNERN